MVRGVLVCAPQTVLEQGGSFAGVNRKVQLKPLRWAPPEEGGAEPPRIVEALLILKHGGVLTHAGRQQARPAARAHGERELSSSMPERKHKRHMAACTEAPWLQEARAWKGMRWPLPPG
jgi:hypothetical protein